MRLSTDAPGTWPPTCEEWDLGFSDQYYDTCEHGNGSVNWYGHLNNNPCNCHQNFYCGDEELGIQSCGAGNLVLDPCSGG